MGRIRWGVLSTANIASRRVIPAIHNSRNGEVVAVASRGVEKARAFADRNGIPRAHGSYEALIEDPNVDAIYIPLPNSLHAEWSIRCAEAGKPTLCEKPLASDTPEAQMMVDAFRERQIPFAEAFMYRFHPRTERVRQLLADGEIGDLQLIDATFSFVVRKEDDVRLKAELAGGSLWDIGTYCVNVMRLMTGEEPIKVHAVGQCGKVSGVDEWLTGVLQFPSAVLGNFSCSLRSQGAHGYHLRGREGCIEIRDGFVPEINQVTEIIVKRGAEETRIEIPPADHYQLMVEDFAYALLDNRPPRFAAEDGVANMAVLDALLVSART